MKRIVSFGLLIFEKVRIPATYIIILCLAYGSRTFVRAERSKLRQENLPFSNQIELTSCRPPNLMTMVGLNGLVITRLSNRFWMFQLSWYTRIFSALEIIYIHMIENHFWSKGGVPLCSSTWKVHAFDFDRTDWYFETLDNSVQPTGWWGTGPDFAGSALSLKLHGFSRPPPSTTLPTRRTPILCLLNQCWMKHTLNLENWVLGNTSSGIWILKLNPCWKQTKGAKVIPSTIQH